MRTSGIVLVLLLAACAATPERKSDDHPATKEVFTPDEKVSLEEARSKGDLVPFASDLLSKGAWDKARIVANECLGKTPNKHQCLQIQIWSFTRRGAYNGQLVAAARACLERSPETAICVWALGMNSIKHGALDEAKVALATLERVAPGSIDTLVFEGALADAAHDTPTACASYTKACDRGQPWACRRVKESCASQP